MGLTDWTKTIDNGNQGRTTEQSFEGDYSYETGGNTAGVEAALVHKGSISDSPIDFRMTGKLYAKANAIVGSPVWYATESGDCYYLAHSFNVNTSFFGYVSGGSSTRIGDGKSISGSSGQWLDFELLVYDDSGTMVAEWTLNGQTITRRDDGDNLPAGGGVGIGSIYGFTDISNATVYWDELEVFY